MGTRQRYLANGYPVITQTQLEFCTTELCNTADQWKQTPECDNSITGFFSLVCPLLLLFSS